MKFWMNWPPITKLKNLLLPDFLIQIDLMPASKKTSSLTALLAAICDQIQAHTETPGLDAQVLLAYICQRDRSWLLAHPEYVLSSEEAAQLDHNLNQIKAGTPLPYVLGEWEFFGRKFKVTPDVLIPRPETELLVETAIDWLPIHPDKRLVAEAGTGSGCIAVSLAAAIPDLQITATEISPLAIAVARENLSRHALQDQITIWEDDLLTNQPGPFDLITANPPYIPTNTLRQLSVYQREPTLALDGGQDGLDLIKRLLAQSTNRLAPGGLILLEIESDQGDSVLSLTDEYFPLAKSQVKPDLAGLPRLLEVQT
jgi:release factor glutamine methyltransferase